MAINIQATIQSVIQAAGIPITHMRFPSLANSSTWQVFPESLQAQAQPIIDAFDPNDPAHETAERDAEIDSLKALRALAEATFELKTQAWTKAQFLARVKAIYRAIP